MLEEEEKEHISTEQTYIDHVPDMEAYSFLIMFFLIMFFFDNFFFGNMLLCCGGARRSWITGA